MDNLDFSGAGAAERGLSVYHLQRTHCLGLALFTGPAAGSGKQELASQPPLLSVMLCCFRVGK